MVLQQILFVDRLQERKKKRMGGENAISGRGDEVESGFQTFQVRFSLLMADNPRLARMHITVLKLFNLKHSCEKKKKEKKKST
jgi:hypothetical protein